MYKVDMYIASMSLPDRWAELEQLLRMFLGMSTGGVI